MTTSRRHFLSGLAIAIVSTAAPALKPVIKAIGAARVMPTIALAKKLKTYTGAITVGHLGACIDNLYQQVVKLVPKDLSDEERFAIEQQVAEEIDYIRPAGVNVQWRTSWHNVMHGKFTIEERDGTVVIS